LHPYSGENGDDIQDFITVDSFEELEAFKTTINQADYLSFISGIGITKEEVRALAETTTDLTPMPLGYESIYVDNSHIEGKGLYSKEDIKKGDIICPGRIDGKRTPAGRYTNHALLHNAKMVFYGEDIELKAIKNITKGDEITVDYRNVINTRHERGEL
jgi:SET domain-containing protein